MPESENLPNCRTGYLLTLSVARKLLEASGQVPLFKFEDVYLTGMVAGLAGVAPTDHVGFNQKVCKKYDSRVSISSHYPLKLE